MTPTLVVMGVSGAGKSTVGALLAARLGCEFADGDAFHPPANVAKMSAGTPLGDEDRWPWLAAIADWLFARGTAGGVVACSALKRAYRDAIRARAPEVRFVHLEGSRALIGTRQSARKDHFMPASLLDSQFAALEPPSPDEDAIAVPVDPAPEAIVAAVLAALPAARG